MSTIPQSVLESGLDFDWDEQDVWQLDYPTQEIDIQQLAWHFEIPFWDWDGQTYNLTPSQVLSHPELYQAQYKRIMSADTRYPIDVMPNQVGQLVILDGLHRLVKHHLNGRTHVPVRIIPRSEITHLSHSSKQNSASSR